MPPLAAHPGQDPKPPTPPLTSHYSQLTPSLPPFVVSRTEVPVEPALSLSNGSVSNHTL